MAQHPISAAGQGLATHPRSSVARPALTSIGAADFDGRGVRSVRPGLARKLTRDDIGRVPRVRVDEFALLQQQQQ